MVSAILLIAGLPQAAESRSRQALEECDPLCRVSEGNLFDLDLRKFPAQPLRFLGDRFNRYVPPFGCQPDEEAQHRPKVASDIDAVGGLAHESFDGPLDPSRFKKEVSLLRVASASDPGRGASGVD